jgi:hypothetical protein
LKIELVEAFKEDNRYLDFVIEALEKLWMFSYYLILKPKICKFCNF